MSTTALDVLPLPTRTRSRWAQVPSVFVAVTGRFAWRLWWPLVPWLLAAALWWFALRAQSALGESVWTTQPAGILLLGGLVAIPILWLGGARFALSLGHDRGVVFGVTAAVSLLLQGALFFVNLVANRLELSLLGTGGIHVFPLESPFGPGVFGTNMGLWNAGWYLGAIYLTPLFVLVVAIACAIGRFGGWGLLGIPAALLFLLAVYVAVATAGVVAKSEASPADANLAAQAASTVVGVVFMLVVYVAPLVVAWLLFRKAPVR